MIYCFDLDNTLCHTEGNDYSRSTPHYNMIEKCNYLFDSGNYIKIFTARGMTTHKGSISLVYNNLFETTKSQLVNWGIKHHELILGKPSFDIVIDDKNISISDFNKSVLPKVGFTAGAFDVIHPGYIKMFKEIKDHCDILMVGLHEDPSIERDKMSPVLNVDDRIQILDSIKFIDKIVVYSKEDHLLEVIKNINPDILFLGDDYRDKFHNGLKLKIKTFFCNRDHGWSTTKFKKLITESYDKFQRNRHL